jgi:hypothetical protein
MVPPSLGEGAGRVVTSCFSRSAKLATSMAGAISTKFYGNVDGCEIMSEAILERDGKILVETWD